MYMPSTEKTNMLMGILSVKGKNVPFTGNHNHFRDLSKVGTQKNIGVFVFTPDKINWKNEHVVGYVYKPDRRSWIKGKFPLPPIVYNRIPKREYEKKPENKACLERLRQKPDVSLFNPHFFDKGELHQVLEKTHLQHLPHTIEMTSIDSLKQMLAQFSQLYIKPINSKAGVGIMKVQKHEKSLHLYTHNKKRGQTYKQLDALWSAIQRLKIKSPYVIQQGISLAHISRQPFDVRVLCQKNKTGDWELTGAGVRVAGKNRITTHVPNGGRIESLNTALKSAFGSQKSRRLRKEIEAMALSIARELEKKYALLGEMSMDIGVDKKGALWFFEANAKPMKFDEPHIRKKSLHNLIDYAQYLYLRNK
jgi:hypothetical protein